MDRSSVPEVNAGEQIDFLGYSELREDFFDIEAGLRGHGTHDGQEYGSKIWSPKFQKESESKRMYCR